MATLKVTRFSCIDDAELHLAPLTVLVGPQASGKSVLSKLVFFFYHSFTLRMLSITERPSAEYVRGRILKLFPEWFPPSAWGDPTFQVTFTAGPIQIDVSSDENLMARGEVKVALSRPLVDFLTNMARLYDENQKAFLQARKDANPSIQSRFQFSIELHETYVNALSEMLSDDYISWQLFLPAGRSFFTTFGRSMASFMQSESLDYVTLEFGKLLQLMRDNEFAPALGRPGPRKGRRSRDLIHRLFGGEIQITGESTQVLADDGRVIPFRFLSSGQQEVMPLFLMLEYYSQYKGWRHLVYIEEPEAHLFPSAQSDLTQYLVAVAMTGSPGPRMVVTTHSPYVLAKINNMLKAGDIGELTADIGRRVARVVPREAWLKSAQISAYAIVDRRLVPIIDPETSLIDGAYLDSVGGEIAAEFDRLLDIQYGH